MGFFRKVTNTAILIDLRKSMDTDTKYKHSKRIQQKQNHLNKQLEIAKSYGVTVEEPHRFQKRHLLNCGDPKCTMCSNPRKIFKEKTIKEKSFDQTKSWDE